MPIRDGATRRAPRTGPGGAPLVRVAASYSERESPTDTRGRVGPLPRTHRRPFPGPRPRAVRRRPRAAAQAGGSWLENLTTPR